MRPVPPPSTLAWILSGRPQTDDPERVEAWKRGKDAGAISAGLLMLLAGIVVANRPAQQQYTYTVEKAPEGFFVIEDTLKGQPCDA